MLLAAVILFLLVLGVSRLADFGILPGEEFGAADVERNEVKVELSVIGENGARETFTRSRRLAAGERLELAYGPTRYPYVWVVAIDQRGQARALIAEKHTAPLGEALVLDAPDERTVLLCMFSAVPRTLEQIQAALDEDVRLPGLRYAWVIGGGPKERPESAEARTDTAGELPP
jgi:hypothetical protein